MSYGQPARSVSPDDEEQAWITNMASMNFDEPGNGPRRVPSASFSLGRSSSILESDTYKWQNEDTELLLTNPANETGASNNSTQIQNNFSRRSSHHDNPLRLSHQETQFEMLPMPVTVRAGSVTRKSSTSVQVPLSGMPSPDDTLVGGKSPPPTSRWGRLWIFGTKSQHRKKGSDEALTKNMSSIAGAGCPPVAEESGGESDAPRVSKSNTCCEHWFEACPSKKEIQSPAGWLRKTVLCLSLWSTLGSIAWLVIAIAKPRYGKKISSSPHMGISPSTARMLSAFVSKTIEMSFVTISMAFIGQALTRRAIADGSRGTTLAEMSIRSWVIEPGTIITQGGRRQAAFSLLGAFSLLAGLVATFYTTASEAIVAPKLKFGSWEDRVMSGYIRSSYGNAKYVKSSCQTMLGAQDKENAAESCTNVMISGESYRNLQAFMSVWADINTNGSSSAKYVQDRPAGTASLNGTTTLYGTWIETENSNVTAHYEETGRIINNVTLAMPHPGVAYAAMSPLNDILQPRDLSDIGGYAVRAGAVSPVVNVLCVNMHPDELSPLVYTAWRNANTTKTGVENQTIGWDGWMNDVPRITDTSEDKYILNSTVVDGIFRWGPKHERNPPVFRMFPADYHTVVNGTVKNSSAIYILGKRPEFGNYTLCELQSWLSPKCSTQFNISGITGSKLIAHCEDSNDPNSYWRSFDVPPKWGVPEKDWKDLANQWQTASDMNGGERNSRPANSRILTQLILGEPWLPTYLPSIAEALAVFAGSTLVLGSVDTPFEHYWNGTKPDNTLGAPGLRQKFNASIATQQYTSSPEVELQLVFYLVLVLMVILNLVCCVYFLFHSRFVTDYTEAHNLFALALNSAPSDEFKGTCGGGPENKDWMVPWRVGHDTKTSHYFIEDTDSAQWRKFCEKKAKKEASEKASYERLRKGRSWL